ncbi:MAG: LysM peptidoglycan-binding domain-containing protein [Elusimicrobia bacterium]|nr:LysM peptidoglycan-binding domain-containing protein [Elusimicrobiota bacterium]
MRNKRSWVRGQGSRKIIFIQAAMAACVLCQISAAGAEEEILEERYVVVKGDTLWQIAVLFRENGYDWSAIYDINRDILKDPNQLVPGQVLKLPGPDYVSGASRGDIKKLGASEHQASEQPTMAAAKPQQEPRGAETKAGMTPVAEAAESDIPAGDGSEGTMAVSTATNSQRRIIRQREFTNYDGRIISSRDKELVMLSQGDIIFISLGSRDGLVPGDELAVIRKTRQATDPRTRKRYWLIERVGRVRVTDEVFDERAECQIIYSHDAISLGDGVMRLPRRNEQD